MRVGQNADFKNVIKKKLKFSFILCAIFFAFFYFNTANAQFLYNDYTEYQQTDLSYDPAGTAGSNYAFKFKAIGNSIIQSAIYCRRSNSTTCQYNACIATQATTTACISGNLLMTCGSTANWTSNRFFGLGTPASYFFNPPAITTKNNDYYLLLTNTNNCASHIYGVNATSTFPTETYRNDLLMTYDSSLFLVGSSTPAEECETCPECETCTGSSTLVHFNFDNATTTDISRIVATSKTYTDDTGTPTSIMVSTFDVPVILFYYIFIIMIMLFLTILLYFKIKKHGKN